MSGADQWNGPVGPDKLPEFDARADETLPMALMRRFAEQLPPHIMVYSLGDRFRIDCLSCPIGTQWHVALFGEGIRTAGEALKILRDDFAMQHMHGTAIPAHWIGGNVPPANDPMPPVNRFVPLEPVKYEEPWLQSRERDAMLCDGADRRAALAAAVQWASRDDTFTDVLELASQCLDWLRYSGAPQRYVKGDGDAPRTS